MAVEADRRPLPTGPVVRLAVAVILLVVFLIRGPSLRIPPIALIVIALGLILVAGEQVRRIWIARRPPVEERVNKHPLGLE
jgi:hypothetical protein